MRGDGWLEKLRDAEIEDLGDDVPVGIDGEEDVLGLQVAVDDPLRVRVRERREERQDDRQRVLEREPPLLVHERRERLAAQELHDDHQRVGDMRRR